jgi:C-terminal processing protease CtpA/Prc
MRDGLWTFRVRRTRTLRLPEAGWFTWSGSVVEGRGVAPDVEVPLSVSALQDGSDNRLEAAIAKVQEM